MTDFPGNGSLVHMLAVDESVTRTARNIEAVRAYLGISQDEMGKVFGRDQTAFSKRQRGKIDWSLHELALIAAAVGLETRHLVGPATDIPWDNLRWKQAPPAPKQPTRKKKLPRLDSNQEPAGTRTPQRRQQPVAA